MRLKHIGALSLGAVLLASCAGLGRMANKANTVQYKVTPSPVAQKGDLVPVEIKGRFPAKYFDKKTSVELTPVLVYGTSEKAFETSTFQGEDFAGNNTVINYEQGGAFTITGNVPFEQAMEVADLKVRIKGTRGTKTKVFPLLKIADGTSTTQQLIASDEQFILAEDRFERITKHQQRAILNFLVNSATVRNSELKDEDVVALNAFAKEVAANEAAEITSVVIEAYASPEGEIRRNEKLADQRAKSSASRVVKRAFGKAKLSVEEDKYNFIPKGEDWLGFKEMMQASSISDKELILRILSMYTDLNKREKEIRNLAATYTEISEKILPELRRSQITINYQIVGKSDAEILDLAQNNSLELNVEELLYAATLTDDAAQQLDFFQKAEKQFGDDERASNNIGMLLYAQGDVAGARAQFEKSLAIKESKEAQNNLAILNRQAGNTAEALSLYRKAMGAGEAVKYNTGVAEIQNGEYGKAVANLSGSGSANEALALTLNGDDNGAKAILDAGNFDADANALYLTAVVEARLNNGAAAVEALVKAIKLDGSLAEKAKKDVEFNKIAYLPAFKAL